jgi:predicted dehydrogenase
MNEEIERILVVGLGSIGKRHVKVIQKLYPNMKIIVLKHSQCNDLETEQLKLYKCVNNLEDALTFQPQAAIVANPSTKHLEIAKRLAYESIHLLIEKPIASTSEGVQDLIELCHSKQIILMVAYNLRFLPALREFREHIQQNKIGDIYSVRTEVGQYLPDWRPNSDYRKTVSAQRRLGGGVLLELSHEIDYLIWIFGSINWVISHMSKQSNLDVDVEDTANIILGFENTSGYKLTATLNIDFIRHDTTRQCIAIGEKGSLRWDGITGKVHYFSESENDWEEIYTQRLEKDYTYVEEVKHFMCSIESGMSPLISGECGLETILGIEAIKKSNEDGCVICMNKI